MGKSSLAFLKDKNTDFDNILDSVLLQNPERITSQLQILGLLEIYLLLNPRVSRAHLELIQALQVADFRFCVCHKDNCKINLMKGPRKRPFFLYV